jgi:hypothetical protein
MTDTPHLGLPQIEAAQAQKHVTHNEALRILDSLVQLSVLDRDLNAPPGSPSEGQRWIVKASPAPTGAWTGHGHAVAAWQDGAWQFSTPQTGWIAHVADEGTLVVFNGTTWGDFFATVTSIQNLALLGVGTTADTTNPFSAKLNNALWVAKTVAEGGDGNLRTKLSKESAAKTLSLLFQDNFSGRAEIGLTGDDDFHFKTSPDGSAWNDALILDRTTGAAKLASGFFLTGDLSPAQITADQNDYNPSGLAGASVLRLSTDASRSVTGLAGGADGRILALINVGSNPLRLKDASSSSTAANRFDFSAELTLNAKQSALLCYDATDSRWKCLAPRMPQRDVLSADRTYYVATTGSDSNSGLTSGAPFLTVQKALDVVAGNIDLNGYTVTIQIADGTYAPASGTKVADIKPWMGGGALIIQGNNATPANVVLSATAANVINVGAGALPGSLTLSGLKLTTTTSGAGINLSQACAASFSALDFGSCAGAHIVIASGAFLQATGNYTISGGATRHWQSNPMGWINCIGRTLTITGTPAFSSAFALTLFGYMNVSSCTFSGGATGSRYSATGNGIINTGGQSATYLPGDTAGSTATGGQYV